MARYSTWLYIIFGLALIGLMSQLFTNTGEFFKSLVYIIGFSAILFFIIRFIFFRNKSQTSDMKKYRRAVKQSKLKYKHHTKAKKQAKRPRHRRRRASHLRVIDGHKNAKRKNRATF